MIEMQVGEKIKHLRKSTNMTQERLAELLGVKKVSIQKYENGGINLKTETLERLGKIFNVSPAYIMGWDAPAPPPVTVEKSPSNDYMVNEIARIFDGMNDAGKRRVLFYAEDISENPKYKGDNQNEI